MGLRYFLRLRANPNKVTDRGDTPLHIASANGHCYAVVELLRGGADPSFRNNFTRTPMDNAAPKSYDSPGMCISKGRIRLALDSLHIGDSTVDVADVTSTPMSPL